MKTHQFETILLTNYDGRDVKTQPRNTNRLDVQIVLQHIYLLMLHKPFS